MRRTGLVLAASALMGFGAAAAAQTAASDDPYIWLETIEGPKVDAWVEAENKRTAAALESDPRFKQAYDDALAIMSARDRIPSVAFRGDALYNFWQDADHEKGIYRRTSLDSYLTADPQWETVFDLDALSKAEGKSWVYKGLNCLQPDDRICLLSLSDGGRDVVYVREFDLQAGKFIDGGFSLPEARNFVDWIDKDTWIVARDWGEGTMTPSNYPFVVKIVKRGEPLSAAREVYRGEKDDVLVGGSVLRDAAGRAHALMAVRSINSTERETYLLGGDKPLRLEIPRKSGLIGIVGNRVLMQLDEPWKAEGRDFPSNSIVSFDLEQWKADPNRAPGTLAWAAGPKQSLDGGAATKDRLIITYLDNVRGRAIVLTPGAGNSWTTKPLALPANASLGMGSADRRSDRAFINVTDFLTPSSLYLIDAAAATAREIKTSPARFDASNLTIEQLSATAKDGTAIPYFIVRPKNMKADGSTPTILYGYGGFQSSEVPYYSGTIGKLWLERGNAYVVANIRGGGEFGAAWHEAAKGATKQVTWDDFIAVAEDLQKRKITSPRRLGVMGGSQGGLLVGTAITQRPELFRAAVIQVPLFDMLRYHLIGNGASWFGEYGDPTKPAERAWLEAYSPYQQLSKAQARIEPFIETSKADDRVTPVHGRKAAARLAELGVPYYYYENTEGGHAAAANIPEKARLTAYEFIYSIRRLED